MKAALRDRYGGIDVVNVRDVERPTPDGNEVLVRVHVASVNRADLDLLGPRPWFTRFFLGVRRPRSPRIGCDVAGVVESVGPDVTSLQPGDRVFADLYPFGSGSFAEFACAPERAFARIPEGVTFEQAATLPHAGILALQGLRRRNGRTPRPGDRVLIGGASGSVGPFAVQLAKALGTHVTGVASTAKLDFVRSLGADEVIDYTTTDYTRLGVRYDWILDVEAHAPLLRVRHVLRPRGVYVTLGGETSSLLSAMAVGPVMSAATRKHVGLMLWWRPFDRADAATLANHVRAGTVRPAIDRTFALDDVAEALRWVDGGRALGKVLIAPDPS